MDLAHATGAEEPDDPVSGERLTNREPEASPYRSQGEIFGISEAWSTRGSPMCSGHLQLLLDSDADTNFCLSYLVYFQTRHRIDSCGPR